MSFGNLQNFGNPQSIKKLLEYIEKAQDIAETFEVEKEPKTSG